MSWGTRAPSPCQWPKGRRPLSIVSLSLLSVTFSALTSVPSTALVHLREGDDVWFNRAGEVVTRCNQAGGSHRQLVALPKAWEARRGRFRQQAGAKVSRKERRPQPRVCPCPNSLRTLWRLQVPTSPLHLRTPLRPSPPSASGSGMSVGCSGEQLPWGERLLTPDPTEKENLVDFSAERCVFKYHP